MKLLELKVSPRVWWPITEEDQLEKLKREVSACTKCRLSESRTNTVFGVGKTYNPLICFIGEGPGRDEDLKGEPFVGAAGKLLTAAITKGLKLRREDVYICNVIKCRAPNNRAPLPDEIESCAPYFYKQIDLIKPQLIVTLGQPASKSND